MKLAARQFLSLETADDEGLELSNLDVDVSR